MLKHRDRPMPEPSYMSKEQTAQYLSDLRQSQPVRPSGGRPLPPSSRPPRTQRGDVDTITSRTLVDDRPKLQPSHSMPFLSANVTSKDQPRSDTIQARKGPFAGRPLARAPSGSTTGASTNTGATRPAVRKTPSMTYMESGSRWMEKQEVRSLRSALEDMDREEEQRVHAAAQDEAAELVWKHRNPNAPYTNPDIAPRDKDYRAHLRKGSYQRSISQSSSSTGGHRSASGGSDRSASGIEATVPNSTIQVRDPIPRKVSPPAAVVSVQKRQSISTKSYDVLAQAVASDIAKAQRRISSGSRRISSSEKKFMHPQDRIWEDPQDELVREKRMIGRVAEEEEDKSRMSGASLPAQPPTSARRNPFARVRMQSDRIERSQSAPILPHAAAPAPLLVKHDRVEIQRNAPSQTRNPWYMSNEPLPPTPPNEPIDRALDETSPKHTPTKDGREIRSDDIRAATSKSRKDYSPNLPRPTVVSDKPGRPIVSFRSREVVLDEVRTEDAKEPARPQNAFASHSRPGSSANVPVPRISVDDQSSRPVPSINFPDQVAPPVILLPDGSDVRPRGYHSAPAVPTICVDSMDAPPAIVVQGDHCGPQAPSSSRSNYNAPAPRQRPLPTPIAAPALPHHAPGAPSSPPKSSLHYTPSSRQSGALCTHCALPIAGRILSAAGRRFHPGCFVCYACRTNLECVAFYPEPDKTRDQRRDAEGVLGAHDDDPRFYCHLDFHELFSPRCKSCKTPIEGEAIVACGAEWHPGHFFCAQCGDPFDASMPFVEKDGYAWCVGCHTNRYSPKCRGCRKPVTDVVVRALGAEWHAGCFVCIECHAEFNDGRYFLRGDSQDPVCVGCEERRLKA